tara:strand:+ start:1022 stop:5230 length:4209 start_codon:yes stop_codon:yes gene_type:complete
MANDINISRHHFYRRQPISVDVELNSTFKDDYSGGTATTVTLSNDIQDTVYLFDGEVPTPSEDYKVIDELYFEKYVNTVSSSTQYAPTYYVYDVKDTYNITEGNASTLDKGLSVYHSQIRPENFLMAEEFDGNNKGFGMDEKVFLEWRENRVYKPSMSITWRNLLKMYEAYGYNIKNPTYYQNTKVLKLVPTVYYYDVGDSVITQWKGFYKVKDDYTNWSDQELKSSMAQWESFGATETFFFSNAGQNLNFIQNRGETAKILASDTYVNGITPYNSIFNNVHKEHNVYDIKVQTLESVGEDEFAFTMNNFDLTTDDFLTGGQSARMHLFWENYSGTATGDTAKSLANCYGLANDKGMMQTMYGCISNIPVPRKLDLLTVASGSSYMPEIEVVFKVKQLPTALRANTTTTTTAGRSLNFVFSNLAPNESETFWDFTKRLHDNHGGSGTGKSSFMHFVGLVNQGTPENFFTFFEASKSGGTLGYDTDTGLVLFSSAGGAAGNANGVNLPFNQFIRMRMREWDNGASMLVYFPDLPTDANGVVPNIVGSDLFSNALYGGNSNFTIAISNFRAIEVGAGSGTNINNSYGADLDGGKNDRQVEVLIDSIKFCGFNHSITNLSHGRLENAITRKPMTLSGDIKIPENPSSEFDYSDAVGDRGSKTTNDNYFTLAKTPSPNIVSFGFDSKTSLANTFLQLNNYKSFLGAASNQITNNFIKWGYSDDDLNAGPVTTACINLTQGTDIVTAGDLFADNFSKKGFMKISGSTAINNAIGGTGGKNWVKTVNPWVSALILEVSEDGRTIVVDNPEIFDEPVGSGGQMYVAYRQNNSTTLSDTGLFNTYAGMNVGSGSVGQKADDLYQIRPREGNVIFLNRPILRDDKQATDMATTTYKVKEPQIQRCLISPKKFWLWGMIQSLSPQSTASNKWGEWSRTPFYSGSALSPKVYDSVKLFSNTGTIGSTYNEFLYNDGSNQNLWTLDYLNPDGIVNMDTDYGYGKYIPAEGEEPAKQGGYICKDVIIGGADYKYYNLSPFAEKSKLTPKNKLKFGIFPEFGSGYFYNINFDSAEGSKPPNLIFGFNKPLPVIEGLTVSPKFDYLKDTGNIEDASKATGTDIVFNWEESKDIDYRILFVDTVDIKNKYHKASFIAPLNESGTTATFYPSAETYIAGTGVSLTGTNLPDIEGAQGYATKFAGSSQLKDNTVRTRFSATEFTVMATINPSTGASSGDDDVVLEVSGSSGNSIFELVVNNSKQVEIKIDGSTKLTSTTSFSMDGANEQLAIVTTYNKSLTTDNLKLYINGKLEDTANYTTNITTDGKVFIGGDNGNSNFYSGFVEEVSIHTKECFVVTNPKQYVLSTKHLNDGVVDGADFVSHNYQARMFGFDKTNIRGLTKDEVCTSNVASWKITGVF